MRHFVTAILSTIMAFTLTTISANTENEIVSANDVVSSESYICESVASEFVPPEVVLTPEVLPAPSEESTDPEVQLTKDEIELIALVTMAEAEAEPVEGQRLVIDTILNRVDSPYFPDTVHDVIYQKNQFTSMTNGRVDRCYIREDLVNLVYEELESRYNSEVVFFRTTRYSDYGVPLFQVGHHYFSKYE